ncbi:peptidoglycan-binding protein [Devosia sp. Root436]|uniref:peptidoglycan-binding protein n=1 Tax=Devosia sp. Root436 TaxID=1736537 RepID=UPI000ADA17D5|nr:peptidoglycan-binding protein [Devosia sp. Root436]
MVKSIRLYMAPLLLLPALTSMAAADDAVRNAQGLLVDLGYNPGPIDGQIGRRTIEALEQFSAASGGSFDGTVDDAELAQLAAAAERVRPRLNHPGHLFDLAHAIESSCNGLGLGRFVTTDFGPTAYPPIISFDDSQSIGMSAKREASVSFAQALVVHAAAAGFQGNQPAAAKAREALLAWAEAGAGLDTAIDNSYLGAGNAGGYDPEADAPVLDMENAALLGGVALTTTYMLGDLLTAQERETILAWALALVNKYRMDAAVMDGTSNGVFMGSYPALLGRIMEGDAAGFESLVSAYYRLLRNRVDEKGAILKNANRGDRALHYQSIGILSMMSLFELVEAQGNAVPADLEADLHRAVTFFLDGDRDLSVIAPYAKMGFNNPGTGQRQERFYRQSSEHYWWMVDYIARYPDSENATRLRALLGPNDTFEKVRANIMGATWAAYPINCIKSFDLSAQTTADAVAYVRENYPAVIVPSASGRKMGLPHSSQAVPISFARASVMRGTTRSNFETFFVNYGDLHIGDEALGNGSLEIYVDFAGDGEDLSNLALLRIVGQRTSLHGADSKKADFQVCGQVASQQNGSNFRLHVGEMEEMNSCILDLMDPPDAQKWASLLDGLQKLINEADESPGQQRLKQLFDYMVY